MRLSLSLDTETGRIAFFTNEKQPLPDGAAKGFEFVKAADADVWTLVLTDANGKSHDFSKATARAGEPGGKLTQDVANYLSKE